MNMTPSASPWRYSWALDEPRVLLVGNVEAKLMWRVLANEHARYVLSVDGALVLDVDEYEAKMLIALWPAFTPEQIRVFKAGAAS